MLNNLIEDWCFGSLFFTVHSAFACNHPTMEDYSIFLMEKPLCCSGQVVSDAGHSANEPGIAAELVAANEKLKNLVKKNEP